ncbi:MAG: methyltransferase domain-containing protein [Alphaproteobacteria bacterium]
MTSGNLLADRRLDFARDLAARGDVDAAVDLARQALELAPDWVGAWFLLGEWCDRAGRRDEAVAAYGRCLALDPADRAGAVVRLALLGAVAAPPVLPPAYVAGVFDDCAEAFDRTLVERLEYAVPGELHDLVAAVAGAGAAYARVLDLGCGTGLAGERFRLAAAWLEGVDLSEGMLAVARRKSLYDTLVAGDLLAFLGATAARYDLILAADVLIYLGDLAAAARAVAAALVPGGRFAFSVESMAGDGFCLTAGHRFAYGEGYLRRVLEAAGLAVEAIRPTTCRLEGGRPVAGLLAVSRRPAAPADGLVPTPPAAGDDAEMPSAPNPPLH